MAKSGRKPFLWGALGLIGVVAVVVAIRELWDEELVPLPHTAIVSAITSTPPSDCDNAGPEDVDGYQDDDGCLDLDNDGDGIPDDYDGAPLEPEDVDGDRDYDGIPDPESALTARELSALPYRRWAVTPREEADSEAEPTLPDASKPASTGALLAAWDQSARDGDDDGLADVYDRCPEQAEDLDEFEDRDGCPETDNDRDGIPDTSDTCPLVTGMDCDALLEIRDKIYFATGRDAIELPKSSSALTQVLKVLTENPQIRRMQIQGHTDNEGTEARNLKLSKNRAESVRRHLIDGGIEPDRLVADGFGATRSVMSNKTEEGRTLNRRVEFHVLDDPVEKPPPPDGGSPQQASPSH